MGRLDAYCELACVVIAVVACDAVGVGGFGEAACVIISELDGLCLVVVDGSCGLVYAGEPADFVIGVALCWLACDGHCAALAIGVVGVVDCAFGAGDLGDAVEIVVAKTDVAVGAVCQLGEAVAGVVGMGDGAVVGIGDCAQAVEAVVGVAGLLVLAVCALFDAVFVVIDDAAALI